MRQVFVRRSLWLRRLSPAATLELNPGGAISPRASRPSASLPSGRWRPSPRGSGETVTALRHLLGEANRPIRPRLPITLSSPSGASPATARTEYATKCGRIGGRDGKADGRGEGGRQFEAFFRSDGLVRRIAIETSTARSNAAMRLSKADRGLSTDRSASVSTSSAYRCL